MNNQRLHIIIVSAVVSLFTANTGMAQVASAGVDGVTGIPPTDTLVYVCGGNESIRSGPIFFQATYECSTTSGQITDVCTVLLPVTNAVPPDTSYQLWYQNATMLMRQSEKASEAIYNIKKSFPSNCTGKLGKP